MPSPEIGLGTMLIKMIGAVTKYKTVILLLLVAFSALLAASKIDPGYSGFIVYLLYLSNSLFSIAAMAAVIEFLLDLRKKWSR